MRSVLMRYAALAVLFLGNNVAASPFASYGNSSAVSTDAPATPTITPPPALATPFTPTATSTCTITFNPFLENIDVDDFATCNGSPATLVPARNVYEYVTWNHIMASECSSSYESSLDAYKATEVPLVFTVTMSSDDVPVKTTTYSLDTGEPWNFMPTSGSPCCLNCTLYGDSVEAYYWPTSTLSSAPTGLPYPNATNATITAPPASASVISMLVNDANFTFTYPSIYIVFHSLSADDYCGQVGPVIENATVAFNPGELMTARGWTWSGSYDEPPSLPNDYQVGNWDIQPTCENITSSFYQNVLNAEIWTDPADSPTSCTTDLCWIETYTITWDPCKPNVSVPPQVFGINTAWSSCQSGVGVMKDPPYILTSGPALTPLTITVPGAISPHASTPTSSPGISVAQPGSTVTPQRPFRTTPPSVIPTSFPEQPNNNAPPDTPSNDPSPNGPSGNGDPSGNGSPSNTPPSNDPPSRGSPGSGPAGSGSAQDPQVGTTPGDFHFNPTTPAPEYVIGSQTLTPNGPAITVSGTTYSLLPDNSIVINGNTQSFIQGGSSTYIIGSQWLIAGSSAITVDGTRVSLMPGGSSVVVGGTTEAISGFIAPKETGTGTKSKTGFASFSLGGFVTPTKAPSSTGSGLLVATKSSAERMNNGIKGLAPLLAAIVMILGIMEL